VAGSLAMAGLGLVGDRRSTVYPLLSDTPRYSVKHAVTILQFKRLQSHCIVRNSICVFPYSSRMIPFSRVSRSPPSNVQPPRGMSIEARPYQPDHSIQFTAALCLRRLFDWRSYCLLGVIPHTQRYGTGELTAVLRIV